MVQTPERVEKTDKVDNQKRQIFRQEALDHLSSPEQLDQLMQLVSPKAWLPLVAMGFLVVVGGVWSVVGRIPLTVTGSGVLIRPRHVVQFQAPSGGQLSNLNIKPGDAVKKGQVIAIIDQSKLKQELQQEQTKLAELQQQNQDFDILQKQQIALEQRTLQQQRRDLEESLRRETLAPDLRDKTLSALEQKRKSLQESLQREQGAPNLRDQTLKALDEKRKSLELQQQQNTSLLQTLQERVESMRRLFEEERAVSQDLVLKAEQEYFNAEKQLSEVEAQLKELDVQASNSERDYRENLSKIDEIKTSLQEIDVQVANTEREYQQNLNKIDEIKTKIKDIDAQETKLVQQSVEKGNEKNNQIQEVKRRIAQLELQLAKESKIISQYDGHILELNVVPGQIVNPGNPLGSLEAEDPNEKIVSVIYFPDKDGKQIKPGMTVQVTPSVVKRERYGGITAVVTNVSPFPVTTQNIKAVVGNEDLANSLAKQGEVRVQVFADLQEDPSTTSGYKWSSSNGPPLKISSGTTTTVRVKVGEQAPISYIIPLFRSWTGLY